MSDVGTTPGMRSDDAEIRRKRLLFRCWHRGTQEIDLIFGSFAERSADQLSTVQLDRFEALLDCNDGARLTACQGGRHGLRELLQTMP